MDGQLATAGGALRDLDLILSCLPHDRLLHDDSDQGFGIGSRELNLYDLARSQLHVRR